MLFDKKHFLNLLHKALLCFRLFKIISCIEAESPEVVCCSATALGQTHSLEVENLGYDVIVIITQTEGVSQ